MVKIFTVDGAITVTAGVAATRTAIPPGPVIPLQAGAAAGFVTDIAAADALVTDAAMAVLAIAQVVIGDIAVAVRAWHVQPVFQAHVRAGGVVVPQHAGHEQEGITDSALG